MRRRERRRRVAYITIISVVVVVVILVAFAIATLYQQNPQIGKPVSSRDYRALEGIATSASYGPVIATLMNDVKVPTGSPFREGTEPIVVFISAEYCPYCAFMRWPLTIALMRFGNFSGLRYMQSSSTDTYPPFYYANEDTFTYHGATYSSQYIVFQSYETETRTGASLQTVPSNYTAVWETFSPTQGVPFLDVANKYAIPGTFYLPNSNLGSGRHGNWSLDIQNIANNNTALSYKVMSAANAITALICQATGGNPHSVCANPSVTGYSSYIVGLAAYVSSPSASFAAGSPSSSATAWSNVQYRQTAPRTKTSA